MQCDVGKGVFSVEEEKDTNWINQDGNLKLHQKLYFAQWVILISLQLTSSSSQDQNHRTVEMLCFPMSGPDGFTWLDLDKTYKSHQT
jgi:hypothetical protein